MIFETKQVVMLVIAKTLGADDAVGDGKVSPGRTMDGDARIGEMLLQRGNRVGTETADICAATPPESLPLTFDTAVMTPLCDSQHMRSRGKEMTGVLRFPCAVISENMESAIVRIPQLRHQTIRAKNSKQKLDHVLQPSA